MGSQVRHRRTSWIVQCVGERAHPWFACMAIHPNSIILSDFAWPKRCGETLRSLSDSCENLPKEASWSKYVFLWLRYAVAQKFNIVFRIQHSCLSACQCVVVQLKIGMDQIVCSLKGECPRLKSAMGLPYKSWELSIICSTFFLRKFRVDENATYISREIKEARKMSLNRRRIMWKVSQWTSNCFQRLPMDVAASECHWIINAI